MKRPPHFEIMPQPLPGWYFRVVASNGRIMAHGWGYDRLASAKKACRAINPKLEIRVIR